MTAQTTPGPVDFDLSRGRVDHRAGAGSKTGADHQVVLVPLSALVGLDKAVGHEASKVFVRAIGVSFGRRVAARLGAAEAVAGATLEAFVSALAGEVAVSGWGVLHLERWGRAMVLVVENAPSLPGGLFAALLEGAIEAAAAREVHGVSLLGDRAEGGTARVLIASEKTAERAQKWLVEGASEADVLRRLHEESKGGGAS
jgi:hypothetical protein